jgi:carboxyl-terminal processing protease
MALAVRRDGQVFERQVTRKAITLPSVRSDAFTFQGKRVGYFVIDEFNNHADEELGQQLAAQIDRLDAVVLNVTGNPGGALDAVAYIASLFLASEKPLYWLVDRGHPEGTPVRNNFDKAAFWRDELTPAQLRKLETLPLIVMANGYSASASELLAGALQDNGRAKVFGTQTHGKGSVQTLFDLPNGEGVKLTTARYLTPNRHKVEGVGIKPDFTPESQTPQSTLPVFENGTFPKDELNTNWLLQATEKLLGTSPAVASR